ncbi:MAG: hypothetical protein GQ544_06995 [Candidatus Aminicenantes bacterium]|nr:hypothetical protein [Candidatus Aminicenantes bacterium]
MRPWWHDMYPEEVEIASDGSKYRQSFASQIWREQAKDFLRGFIAHLQKIGLDDRVVAYQVGAGHTGEWVKGKISMYYLTGDYSRPMQEHFREWLKEHYHNDVNSLRIHNKLYLFEDDTRTHTNDHPAYGRARDLQESTAILKRNLAYIATHGHGVWWLINQGHMDPTYEPAFKPLIKSFQELGTFIQYTNRTPSAEVAVLLDDESFFYETVKNELDFPLIFKQRLVGLPRMGAPFDVYLLHDFLEGRLRPYKLYIFLNAFRLDEHRRSALKKELRRGGRTAVWIYAPGYIKDMPAVENIEDITGIKVASHDRPWPSYIHITNYQHALTQNLTQDVTWGTDSRLAPLFHVEDPEAVELGQVVYSQGRCRVGYALKKFPEWTSIYSAVPNLPSAVLREIARTAGVHLYSEKGDVLYATSELLGVHTLSGGTRRFELTRNVEIVYDLFNRKAIAEGVRFFEVSLDPVSTSLFYTGKKELLQRLRQRP